MIFPGFTSLKYFFAALQLLFLRTVFAEEDNDCFLLNHVSSEFRISPGHYDVETVTLEECQLLCEETNFTYAAMMAYRFCLCSFSDDDVVTKGCSEVCGDSGEEACALEQPDLLKIAEIETKAIWEVSLKVEVEIEQTPDPHAVVHFVTEVKANIPFEVTLFLGDGTFVVMDEEPYSTSRSIRLPGKYYAKAIAHDTVFAQVIMDETDFWVPDTVLRFELECPVTARLYEVFFCNMTFYRGTDLVVTVSFEGEGEEAYKVPDAVITEVGGAVPSQDAPGYVESSFSDIIFLAHNDMPTGNIMGFEYYAATKGNFEILVMSPKCSEDEKYCSCQENCQDPNMIHCNAGSQTTFCTFPKSCIDDDDLPYCTRSTKRSDLQTKYSFDVEVSSLGYQYLEISSEEPKLVAAGDVLGFKQSDSAKLFFRNATADEMDDAVVDVDEDGNILNVRHFLRALIATPANLSLQRSLSEKGNHSIAVEISSETVDVKDKKTAYVFAGYPIEDVKLFSPSECVEVNSVASVGLVVQNGTDITLSWTCSNEDRKQGNLTEATGEEVFESFTCTSQKNFTVFLEATNAFNTENSSAEFCCLHPVGKSWVTNTNSPQTHPPGVVKTTLKYSGTPEQFPHGTSLVILCGHDVYSEPSNFDSESFELSEDCPFSQGGSFNISWNISNSISTEIFTSTVMIYEKLGILQVTAQYSEEQNKDELKDLHGKSKTDVPVGALVHFFCEINGTVQYYTAKIENEDTPLDESTSENTYTDNVIKHQFDEVSKWKLDFAARNPVQESNVVTLRIRSMRSTTKLQLTASKQNASVGEDIQFHISFDSSDKFTCITFDPGDGSKKIAFGDEESCLSALDEDRFTWTDDGKQDKIRKKREAKENRWIDDKTISVVYAYLAGGVFNPTAEAFNSIFKTQDAVTIEVISESSDIWIENNSTNINYPQKFFRGQDFRLETTAVLTYNSSYIYTMKWTVYRISDSGSILEEIDVSDIKSHNCSAIRIHLRYLEVGLYKFVYTIVVEEGEASDDDERQLVETRSCYSYVEIISTPLIPIIIKGGGGYIVRGNGQNVHLEVSVYSEDPNDLSDKNFKVSWSCRRFDRSKVLPQMANHHPLGSPDATFIDKNVLNDAELKGGCFKDPESNALEGNNVVLNTGDLLEFDALYEIAAVIKKDVREADTNIFVDVIEDIPLGIIIMCEKTSACHRSDDGFLINPSTWISVMAECVENCVEEIIYSWEIYGVDESTAFAISDFEDYIIVDEDRLGINRTMFESHSSTRKYHVKVAGQDPLNSSRPKGVAELYLYLNDPPSAGSCTINATTGYALIDVFSLTFNGWSDPNGNPIIDYSVYVVLDGLPSHIHYGVKTYAEFILPAGDATVTCSVTDSEGGVAVLLVGNIKVKMPPKPSVDDWEKSVDMRFYMVEGKICMMSQAIAAEALVSQEQRRADYVSLDEAVNRLWTYYCSLPGIDSSYYTVQAKEEIKEELEEERAKEKSKLAEKNLERMRLLSLLPLESLEDAEVYGDAVSALAESRPLNRESKVLLMELLSDLFESTFETDVPHPSDRNISLEQIGNGMNCLSRTLANEMIGGDILFSELEEAEEFWHYNLTQPNPFILYVNGSRWEVQERVRHKKVETAQDAMKEEAVSQVEQMRHLARNITKYVVQELMVGSSPMIIDTDTGFKMIVKKSNMEDFNSNDAIGNDEQFRFPSGCALYGNEGACNSDSPPLGTVAVKWSNILDFRGSDNVSLSPGSSSLDLSLTNRKGDSDLTVEDLTDRIEICLPLTKPEEEEADNDNDSFTYVIPEFSTDDDFLIYHKLAITSNATVKAELIPDKVQSPLVLLYGIGYKPSLFEYEERVQVKNLQNETGIYNLLVDINGKLQPGEEFFLAIGHLGKDVSDSDSYFDGTNSRNLTRAQMTNEFSTNYSIRIFTTGCYYFVEEESSWSSDGCEVKSANSSMICCLCNHLTFFGSGFVVAPNSIDFDYVFAHAAFESNLAIYCTLIVTFSLYIILLIWARWKDGKDKEKIGASPLPDNDIRDKYLYEIIVQTGFQYNAGTKSKVFFIVSGEESESEVRTLADDQRTIFSRSSIDVFVMAVPRYLGQLNYLRIWHDNSGKGKHASWYLKYVIFKDLQTGLKYEFLVDRWLAVEEGDGLIDHLIPVAGREQTTEFSHLFPMASRRSLSDNHLWFSIFLRPVRSRFTRVQRLSCCMAVLYLSMLTSAMWYQTTPEQPSLGAFKFGPLSLSPEQIGIGLMSNLVVFPPSFLIIFIFRKSRPRILRPSHVEEALKMQYRKWKKQYGEKKVIRNDGVRPPQMRRRSFDEESQLQHKVKKKFSLPWWCVIFGWILVILSIGSSIFFLWAYGLQFGEERTTKWLSSLVVSFFSSVILTEPIKIFCFALLMSCLCGNQDVMDDDADEDEETPYLNKDEEWLHQISSDIVVQRPKYRPMDQKALEAARKYREKELKMYNILKEIGAYALYLWVLMVLSYGNRDPNNFFMRETVINGFIKPGDLWNDFNKVNTEVRFWNWTREALIPELFAGLWYNNRIPLGLRLYVDDRYNLKIGYAVLRQVRTNHENCRMPPQMLHFGEECAAFSNIIHEEGSFHAKFWSTNYTIETRIPPEYKYMTAQDLNGFPFCGQVDWYGGGGYIVPLIAKRFEDGAKLIAKMNKLEQDAWINKDTRAVFVEFGTYNAQVNLFVVVTIVAEFIPGGGIVPYYHIDPIKLLQYHTGSGLIQLMSQIGFIIFTIYYTYCQIAAISKQGKKYFTEYWNIAELFNLLAAYAGIVVEIYKLVITRRILDIFTSTEGTGYIKLQEALLLDESFCYLIGFLMSLSTLKFLKLLRFNKRIGIMASTLRLCAQELQSYGVCLLITFFAFVALFWLTLGKHMKEFCSFFRAFESAISMMLKKFNYPDMEAASPLIAPLSFFTFALTASLVLVNILLTLIIQSYEVVKRDEGLQGDDYELIPFMINRLKLITGIGKPKIFPMPPLQQKYINGPGKLKKDVIGSFPGKVNKLLDFINSFYFEDKMDFTDKMMLEQSAVKSSDPLASCENQSEKRQKLRPRKLPRYQSNQMRKQLDF